MAEDTRQPQKAAHSLLMEIGQNIKDKKKDKELGMGTHTREGVVKEEMFPNRRRCFQPWHQQVCGEFWSLRGQHNWEEKRKQNKTQTRHLTTTASGKVAQMLAFATSKQGLNRDAGCMLRMDRA